MTKPQVRVECLQALCQIISNVTIRLLHRDSFQKPTIAIRFNLLQVYPFDISCVIVNFF